MQVYLLLLFWIYKASTLISEQVRAGEKKQVVYFVEASTSQVFQKVYKGWTVAFLC